MIWTLLAQTSEPVMLDYKELTAFAVILGITGGLVMTMRNLVSGNNDKLWALWTKMIDDNTQTRTVYEKSLKVMEEDSKADREAFLLSIGQVTAELREMNASIGELKRSRQWRTPGSKPGEGTQA
jgi:hypothetical protein